MMEPLQRDGSDARQPPLGAQPESARYLVAGACRTAARQPATAASGWMGAGAG